MHLEAPGEGTVTGWYWIAVADSFEEVTRINRMVRQKSPPTLLYRTHHYWYRWLHKDTASEQQTKQEQHIFQRSLLLLREHINNNGAVIASTDYAMAQEYRDTYCYVWPRDAAITISALLEAKYTTISNQFFHFCHSIITKEGYLLHKYNPDGSLASSWIGWYYENKKELPVQEDETALVLWTLWRYFDQFHAVEAIKPLYRGLVIRAANWLLSYRDERGLPLPSWDLWEERRGISAWTVGATWAGLQSAAYFAEAFGEFELAESYQQAAEQMHAAAQIHFWQSDLQRYSRLLLVGDDGNLHNDNTRD